jgi:16S rRNA (cytosine967-C5)-methyltransferase
MSSRAGQRRTGISPARECAYAVVRRVFERGAYADRALHAQAAGLDARERALATTLAYGTIQRRATLDHVIGALSRRPLADLDPPVLAALRLGAMQLLLLDGIADHAAVHESVELAKRHAHGGAGLVNAVLRRAAAEGPAMLADLSDATADEAATLHSVPRWLAEMWWEELGADTARALLRHINRPAESALRVNTLVAEPAAVASELGVPSEPAPELPEGLIVHQPFDAHGSPAFTRGAIMPQSRGSMLVARALAPAPGQRALDLCAAPGAKTTHLAALMGDEGDLVAVERHPGRAAALRRTLERMRVTRARVEVADASRPAGDPVYDRVLVDPPCSGLGTLQSRPDLRWRVTPQRIADAAALQARILQAAGEATAPGGALVYSVCTISRRESEDIVTRFVDEHSRFTLDSLSDGAHAPFRRLWPHVDGTDGFFIARLQRR